MEIFKPIPDTENRYFVSNTGKVKNAKGIMKLYKRKDGYLVICLRIKGKSIQKYVHTLVAKTFLPTKLKGQEVNHKDGNKQNNALENLEYCTKSENVKHSFNTLGRKPTRITGDDHYRSIPIIDLQTGVYYSSLRDAKAFGNNRFSITHLRYMLTGKSPNKTSLVIA